MNARETAAWILRKLEEQDIRGTQDDRRRIIVADQDAVVELRWMPGPSLTTDAGRWVPDTLDSDLLMAATRERLESMFRDLAHQVRQLQATQTELRAELLKIGGQS